VGAGHCIPQLTVLSAQILYVPYFHGLECVLMTLSQRPSQCDNFLPLFSLTLLTFFRLGLTS